MGSLTSSQLEGPGRRQQSSCGVSPEPPGIMAQLAKWPPGSPQLASLEGSKEAALPQPSSLTWLAPFGRVAPPRLCLWRPGG